MTPATYEPVWRALQSLPRDASDGERAMAAIKAMPDAGPGWFVGLLLAVAFALGVVMGVYSGVARV